MLLQLRIIFHTDLSSDWQSSELCYFRRGASHNNGGGGGGGEGGEMQSQIIHCLLLLFTQTLGTLKTIGFRP